MDMPARTPGEPVADRLRLVGRIVVHDDVELEIGRNVGLDVIQELPELSAAVAPVALSDDRPGGDVEGGEQRGRAIALVVMSASLDLAGPQRQQGLGAIEGLGTSRPHREPRRVHVQPDDVAHLVHEVRVRRERRSRCGGAAEKRLATCGGSSTARSPSPAPSSACSSGSRHEASLPASYGSPRPQRRHRCTVDDRSGSRLRARPYAAPPVAPLPGYC